MSDSWRSQLDEQLRELDQQSLRRVRGGVFGDASSAGETVESWLDFGSNDYLALRDDPRVCQAVQQAAGQWGWGSGASPVLGGYSRLHARLEQRLAELSAMDACLVFSSGYTCNVGVLSSLLDESTIVFSDRLNHASLIDGMRLGRATRVVYDHCHADQLEQLLQRRRGQAARGLIVTESIFSMDGDEAPLERLVELAEQFDCGLVVDEAHAVGVFGDRGGGLLEQFGLTERVLLKLGTLSKALGGIGGYAAGCPVVIDYLVNRCRSYLFSTAPPAAAMAGSLAAVEQLPAMSAHRQRLGELAAATRRKLLDLGWSVPAGRSPIVPVLVGDALRALELARRLRRAGILVPAIRPPTVPPHTCRLRISLSARHTPADIDRLCQVLGRP